MKRQEDILNGFGVQFHQYQILNCSFLFCRIIFISRLSFFINNIIYEKKNETNDIIKREIKQ